MPEVIERLLCVERNRVLVGGDRGAVERLFRRPPGRLLGTQIDQHQMRIGTARDNIEPFGMQRLRQSFRVLMTFFA